MVVSILPAVGVPILQWVQVYHAATIQYLIVKESVSANNISTHENYLLFTSIKHGFVLSTNIISMPHSVLPSNRLNLIISSATVFFGPHKQPEFTHDHINNGISH